MSRKNAGKGNKETMKIKTAKKSTAKKVVTKKAPAKKPAARKPAGKVVLFTVHADKGKAVYIAGEFNKWDPTAKKMAYKARSGIYTATVKLAPGSYQYKFVIDGTWCADPENVNAVPNGHGTFNSVVSVKSPRKKPTSRRIPLLQRSGRRRWRRVSRPPQGIRRNSG